MEFLTAFYTDIGTRKKTNQDSMLILKASADGENILFASVCDGMGGLAKGEVASAAMIKAFSSWFQMDLPELLAGEFKEEALYGSWRDLITDTSRRIEDYGRSLHVSLGTTAVALLLMKNRYYLLNVGDSRIYSLTDHIEQMTVDQTYVQREIDLGRMTEEEALVSPNRSVLLQCIGASPDVLPDFASGEVLPGQLFMLCCDGFRHVIRPEEFYDWLYPPHMKSREIMTDRLAGLTALNIRRGEDDNISAVTVKVLKEA